MTLLIEPARRRIDFRDLGDGFYRFWRYYLLACAGYFRSGQGQLWQLLNVDKKGGRPLNIMAAIKFAEGLNVRVSDFSPSLQEAIDRLVPFASESVKKVQEPGVKYRIEPENARRTDIATLLSIAETLNDAGLARLIERAEALAETHPARQQKQA